MKKLPVRVAAPCLAVCTVVLSVWGPEALTVCRDQKILDEIHEVATEPEGEGYRYRLSSSEKLFILSECLNSQTLPESEQSALTNNTGAGYQETGGTYAFVVNHRGPSGREITSEQIYSTCNEGLETLKELGILPAELKEVEPSSYDATLYSAIDVPEPRNNVAVWKLSLANSQKNANKENRLIDAYLDADDGKIYEFYVRTALHWEDIDPDALAGAWAGYMGLGAATPYETENPLLETASSYQKYVFPANGGEKTIVTIGFYEGINELFLKISK